MQNLTFCGYGRLRLHTKLRALWCYVTKSNNGTFVGAKRTSGIWRWAVPYVYLCLKTLLPRRKGLGLWLG